MSKTFLKKFILILTAVVLVVSSVVIISADEYTYESEFAKLPDEIKAMSNIRLIDDHDEAVTQKNCGDNSSPNHFYGSSYFTGGSGASLTLDFEGKMIGVLVEKGGFDVYIDDEFIDTVTVKSRSDKKASLVYYNDALSSGSHTITVVTNKEAAVADTGDQYSLFRGFIVQDNPGATPTPVPTPTAEPEPEFTYESEFAKLPDEIKAMENIRLIDDHDEAVTQKNCGDNSSPNHFYGSSYFTGGSGASLTLDFEGKMIGVLVEKGGFDVYIDDEFIDTVTVKSRSDKKASLVYYNDALSSGSHTITVITNKEAAVADTGDQYSLFRGFIVQNVVTPDPTQTPTAAPTQEPTDVPTQEPTDVPTQAPTDVPTQAPTDEPTQAPETDAPQTGDSALIVFAVLAVIAAMSIIIIKKRDNA